MRYMDGMMGAAVFGCVSTIFGREKGWSWKGAASPGTNRTALGLLCVLKGFVFGLRSFATVCVAM